MIHYNDGTQSDIAHKYPTKTKNLWDIQKKMNTRYVQITPADIQKNKKITSQYANIQPVFDRTLWYPISLYCLRQNQSRKKNFEDIRRACDSYTIYRRTKVETKSQQNQRDENIIYLFIVDHSMQSIQEILEEKKKKRNVPTPRKSLRKKMIWITTRGMRYCFLLLTTMIG